VSEAPATPDDHPDRPDALGALPVVGYNQALADARAGRLEPAREALLAALQLDPGFVPALVLAGKVAAQLGWLPEAVRRWEAALARDPDNAAARAGISRAQAMMAAEGHSRALRYALALVVAAALVFLGSRLPLSRRTAEPAVAHPPLQAVAREPKPALPETAARSTAEAARALRDFRDWGGYWLRGLQVEEGQGVIRLRGTAPTQEAKGRLARVVAAIAGPSPANLDEVKVSTHAEVVFGDSDTLCDLAKTYYGDKRYWRRIARANPQLPRDPRHIPTGARMRIPLDH